MTKISKNMKKIISTIIILFSTILYSKSQDIVEVNQEYKQNTDYKFNSEWHYLSTDLYLFNGLKFQDLLYQLYPLSGKKKKNPANELQNILITAKIDGTSLGNLTYPIYNFKVDNSSAEIKTFTADSYEAVRIIDNLPLSGMSGKKVEAAINVEIITAEKSNKVFDFVAEQLSQISSYSTPLSATKTLVGELGNLIKTKTGNQEYKFSSTIRLYEEQDFNKRISSIAIYSFIPSHTKTANIDTTEISKLIKQPNIEINRKLLSEIVKCENYPFMVAVNYRSKYVSEPVVGDETTHETVEARLQKVKKAYDSQLLSQDIYRQEIKLIDFLKQFVQLKNNINNYLLNYRNKTTEDFSGFYYNILNDYLSLNNIYNDRLKEFSKDPIFVNEFKSLYENILTNSDVYFDAENNLKNIKNIAKEMYKQKNNASQKFNAQENEKTLATLHSIQFSTKKPLPQHILELNNIISTIENQQYKNIFADNVNKLNNMQPSEQANTFCEKLKTEINATYCQTCREKATVAVSEYAKREEEANRKIALSKAENTKNAAGDMIFNLLEKEQTINKHFANDFPNGLTPQAQYVKEQFVSLQKKREILQNMIKKDYSNDKNSQIITHIDEMEYTKMEIEKLLNSICEKMPEICK